MRMPAFLLFASINLYKHNTARAFPQNLIKPMKKQRKPRNTVPAKKKSKGKKKNAVIVIELTDDEEDLDVQIIDPLKLSPKDYPNIMEIQTKHQNCDYPWQDVNGLRVARINHFFKQDGEIWFEVMMGRAQTIYREPQLLNFAFLSDKYSSQLYTFLLGYFQSHAFGRV